MNITKEDLQRIIKEEKAKLLSESPMRLRSLATNDFARAVRGEEVLLRENYDPASELIDVMQFLSDAHMRLEEVADFYARQNPNDRRVIQLDSLAGQVKKIQHSVGTHTDRAYKEPAPK